MAAFFSSLGKTIVAGIILLAVIFGIFGDAGAKLGDHAWWAFVMRWLHVLSGVMWIGLLWYFNFVQTPSMPKIPDEQKPAVSIRGIARPQRHLVPGAMPSSGQPVASS